MRFRRRRDKGRDLGRAVKAALAKERIRPRFIMILWILKREERAKKNDSDCLKSENLGD